MWSDSHVGAQWLDLYNVHGKESSDFSVKMYNFLSMLEITYIFKKGSAHWTPLPDSLRRFADKLPGSKHADSTKSK